MQLERGHTLLASLALAVLACDVADEPGQSKAEAMDMGPKNDGTDPCLDNDWYGDRECDAFCPEPDPDCEVAIGQACGGDTDLFCGVGARCSYAPDNICGAEGAGICVEPDLACPEIFAPVCGCDGETYSSECDAHAAGASVAAVGPCDGADQRCTGTPVGPKCGDADYCYFEEVGVCAQGGASTCVLRPTDCPPTKNEVCGCDGLTYDNACAAAQNGVSVLLDEPCFEE